LYEHGVLRPAVKGATGTEKIVITYFLFLHQLLSVASMIKTRTKWTGRVVHTFTMAMTIMMLMESQKLRFLNLMATAYLGILSQRRICDVTIRWDNVKWFNMVREDVTGCCDNSKKPSDFVKGEIFLEWLSDCSLLKDIGLWSSW
jgi:hypothetical protein